MSSLASTFFLRGGSAERSQARQPTSHVTHAAGATLELKHPPQQRLNFQRPHPSRYTARIDLDARRRPSREIASVSGLVLGKGREAVEAKTLAQSE